MSSDTLPTRFWPNFAPSQAGAIACAAIFAVLTIAHVVLTLYRKIPSMWPFTFGALLQTIGYVAREISAKKETEKAPFTIQLVMIIVAPAFFAASHYMIFGRLVTKFSLESKSLISPKIFTYVFVGIDFLSFVIQIIGGVKAAGTAVDSITKAKPILQAGYIIQVAGILIFSVVALVTFFRARRAGFQDPRWTGAIRLLIIGGVVIFIRSLFRFLQITITNSKGKNPLSLHEWTFYAFDSALMAPLCALFIVVHPSKYFRKGVVMSELEMKEEVSPTV